MEQRNFDQFVRAMAAGVSRRGVFKGLTAAAASGPFAFLAVRDAAGQDDDDGDGGGNNRNRNRQRCRGNGESCGGGQNCCPGLNCDASGRCGTGGGGGGGASGGNSTGNQAVVNNNTNVAAQNTDSNVNQTNTNTTLQTTNSNTNVETTNTNQQSQQTQQVDFGGQGASFSRLPQYQIDVECNYESKAFQTVCVGTANQGEGTPPVRGFSLPETAVCAVIIDEQTRPGEYEEVVIQEPGGGGGGNQGGGTANAGTGGTANADASGGTVSVGDIDSGGNQGGNNETVVSIDASGGTANADASGGDNNVAIAGGGGNNREARTRTVLQLVQPSSTTWTLNGNVQPGRQTTYWLDTEVGRYPAKGPSLVQVDDAPENLGVLVVDTSACATDGTEEGYDWFGQCQEPGSLEFALYGAGDDATPLATAPTDGEGLARFPDLEPGTYRLAPNGGTWCHAESNSVDADGNVVVEGGAESNVWIFTCNG